MISKEQLANEQRKEREYNKLFETVISKSPFGQWYPLMIGASNLLTQNLEKRVGIDEDGRPLIVYKNEIGKLMGVWAEPTHKVIARNLGKKQYGKALGAFFGVGQIQEMIRQKKAKFFDISPKEVQEIRNKKIALDKQAKQKADKKVIVDNPTDNYKLKEDKKSYAPEIVLSLIGVAVIVGLIKYSRSS